MFRLPFFKRRDEHLAPLLGDLVAAARAPVAFLEFGVADTFEGRFERLVLVSTLLLDRLAQLPKPAGEVSQELVDAIFAHLDDGLRRSGVGDLSVGKRMKKLAQGFYGRADAYRDALSTGDENALRTVLSRNLYSGTLAPEAVPAGQIDEIRAMLAALSMADLPALMAGKALSSVTGTRVAA